MTLAPYATLAATTRGRLYPEPESRRRSAFQRDRDRIIHSTAFRRLKHKTQVFIAPEGDHYRTRLTHSLEVAQIARSVSRSLGLNEDLAEALALAQKIDRAPNLRFGGLQSYHGRAQHIRDFDERRAAIESAVVMTRDTVGLLARKGLSCDIVGGAGTGTYQFEAASGVYNELQAGSYAFMDADYRLNLKQGGGFIDEFENALFVYATVMSKPGETHAVVDAGLKAYSVDSGLPVLRDFPELNVAGASDEHGKIMLTPAFNDSNKSLHVGDKVFLIPGHVDPTVNLYDWYVCYRGDRVEAVWPITARGALQ